MLNRAKKNIILILMLLTLTTMFFGCSNDDEKSPNPEGEGKSREATLAYQSDVSNLDPIKGGSGDDHALLWPIYDTLTTFDENLELQAGLVEEWEIVDDKTITLKLRENILFHDGTPLDAEAVKYNIERINSDDSNIVDLQSIETVEVNDEHNLTLKLSEADASLLLALSDRGGMMVSPTAVDADPENYSQSPVGAGPYKMKNHIPNGEIEYEGFEDYWDKDKPYLDKMVVKIMTDENTRINALKSGEIDFANKISAANLESLNKEKDLNLKSRITVEFHMIYLNAAVDPIDKKAVRQAILYGIDRKGLIEGVNYGEGEVANGPYPEDYWAANENAEIKYDPEKAKEILKEAGIENAELTLTHTSTAADQKLAEGLKNQLEEVGISIKLEGLELTAAVTKYFDEKKTPAFLVRWTGRPDPQMTINSLYEGESFYNAGSYSVPKLEELIDKAAQTYDEAERKKLYAEINELALNEEAIVIPLYFEPNSAIMNSKIKGAEINLYGKPLFSEIRIQE